MYLFFKRTFDLIISLIAIIVFIPFYIVIPILIAIFIGTPVLIKQKRIGKYNRIFNLYKFRSMKNNKDEEGNMLSDDKRITRFGKTLRNSSLDELPQLFNVLKGDMSIIGPRPKTVEESLFIIDTNYIARHYLRPGLTGLAVIKGRNKLNPDEAYELDIKYIKKYGFWLDFKIFFSTFLVVLLKKGITSDNHVTFVPHYIFWEQKGFKTIEQVKEIRQRAEIYISQNDKWINPNGKHFFKKLYGNIKYNETSSKEEEKNEN